MKDNTHGQLEETLRFAESIQDNSLKECLDHLRKVEENYPEVEHNIYTDYMPRCFMFTRIEILTNRLRMNGGIIFHGTPQEGYRQNGGVQIENSYGWQIHT